MRTLTCISSLKRRDDIKSNAEVWRRHIEGLPDAPSERTFRHWIKLGSKFAAVAAGGTLVIAFYDDVVDDLFQGSVYILIIIVCAQLRIDLEKSVDDFAWQLANVLRCPDSSTFSHYEPTDETTFTLL